MNEINEARAPLKSPVFILGSPRSGTSILAEALRASEYLGYDEGHLLSMLIPLKTAIQAHIVEYVGDDSGQLLFDLPAEDFMEEIFFAVKRFQAKLNPKDPWLDKTPGAAMIEAIPILMRLWPDSVFIFAKRRGIETIVSRMKKFPEIGFLNHCRSWSETMKAWRDIRGTGFPAIEVDQFDIANNSEETASRIGAFLGMDQALTDKLRNTFLTSRPQRTDESSTHRVLTTENCGWNGDELKIFYEICWSEMEAFGYTLDETYRE